MSAPGWRARSEGVRVAPAPRAARLSPPASRARLVALGLALGALAGAGHVPFAAWWLAFPALALALALALPLAPGRAALLGLALGVGHFGLAIHWIVEPFLVDVERHGWMAPFALLGLSLLLGLFWGAAWGAGAWLARSPAPRALLIAAALAASELIRARLLTGFPWASPAYLWSETPLYQALALVGPHGLALLSALAAAGAALALMRAAPLWSAPLGPAALALLALWGAQREIPPPEPGAPAIRLVQPNAAQHLKWDPDWRAEFLRRGYEATAAPPGPLGAPALTVWPEASIPYLLEDARPLLALLAEAGAGAPVAVGIQRRGEAAGEAAGETAGGAALHNSLALIGPEGEVAALYDKHHLVPFGEYMPLGGLASRLGLSGLAAQAGVGFAPGPGPRLIDVPGIGRALPLICYEAVFPRHTRVAERPRLMLHVTNDAWFGTFAGPYQHLAQSRARAIEQGLPVLRAANTGVSAAIDAGGRVGARLDLGVAGHLDAPLPAAMAPPPYARHGDVPLTLGLALLLGAAGVRRTLRRTLRRA